MDMEGVDIPDLDPYKIGKLVNSIASWSFSAAAKTCTGEHFSVLGERLTWCKEWAGFMKM
jgi:hypothetical protein